MCKRVIAPLLVLVFLSLLFAPDFFAAGFGKITGTITDAETDAPVVNASVLVVGTKFGNFTDSDGKYVIPRLSPGTYTLKISSIEYNTVEIDSVRVETDLTTEINQKLTKKIGDFDKTIKVIGKHDIIDRFETTNKQTVTTETVKHKPVQTVDALKEQKVWVRGGRAGEVGYNKVNLRNSHVCPPPPCDERRVYRGVPFDAMFFRDYGVNPFIETRRDRLSTFAADIDDASYVVTRSYIERGHVPPRNAIRAEEFINHFDYGYEPPAREPFEIYAEGAPSRFGDDNEYLLRIGIKGREVCDRQRKPANLVFVVDVSGSMGRENRLGMVKDALRMLVDELRPDDRVGIVCFESRGHVVLRQTWAGERDKIKIRRGIDKLRSGGSTNAEDGLRLGMQMAREMYHPNKTNRVIMLSDGVANTGATHHATLLELITEFIDMGITLSTVGVGMGNFNDVLLEKLGDKGNGHYAYVDNLDEARRIFVESLTSTLQVIARDVKIQIEFDPRTVASYRLIGYENRGMPDHKFRDDAEDGGEIGSGHSVTALYEFTYHRRAEGRDIGTVRVRYKDPRREDCEEVAEVRGEITADFFNRTFDEASAGFRLAAAAAEFAEILKGSYWARGSEMKEVIALAADIYDETENPEVLEMIHLAAKADRYERVLAEE